MMILKVQGHNRSRDEWYIFECYRIHYYSKPKKDYESGHEDLDPPNERSWDFGVLIFTYDGAVGPYGEEPTWPNPDWIVVAHLGTEQDQEYIVTFDTIAYLCNDKGETIEKIEP